MSNLKEMTLCEQPAHWDFCSACGYSLDTGLECERCDYDMMPVSNALSALSALAAEVAALRDDAHRYRWLRDRLEFVDTKQIDNVLSAGVNGCLNQHIDATIDAALRGGSDDKQETNHV